jgi:hypothetical protein
LSVDNDKDASGRSNSDAPSQAKTQTKLPPKKKKGPSDADVGGALRSIYQRTVDERIPPDLLDLLGKLG